MKRVLWYTAEVQETYSEHGACLSVYPAYGVNEINVYRDNDDKRTTTELMVDRIHKVEVDAYEFEVGSDVVVITLRTRDDEMTKISLDCSLSDLVEAINAEQMLAQATRVERNLA